MRHYVKNAKYELKNESGERITVGPMAFVDIPDSFLGDPTYRMALSAGMIEPIISAKHGDKVEKDANEKPGKKTPKGGAKQAEKEPEKEPEKEAEGGEDGEGKAADTQ